MKNQKLALLLISFLLAAFSASTYADGHGGKKHAAEKMEEKVDMVKAKIADEQVPAEMDIVDTALAAGAFNTLAKALTEAGLIDTLKGEGPFTVFAPTDAAFAKIPADTLEAVLADKEKLTAILTYHVVAGKVMAADVVTLDSATTVQGSDVAIAVGDNVTVNDAVVTKTDIEASNGVIHVIDTVLMPAE